MGLALCLELYRELMMGMHVCVHMCAVGRWSGRGGMDTCSPNKCMACLDLHIIPRAVKARVILDLIFWKHTSREGYSNSHH